MVIPAHNAGRTIDAALESVFAQTLKDIEVIVVDDDSTDDTASRVAAFGPRVTCWREHGSIVRALNAGLLLGRSRVIAVLEPTSVWMPRKLERQLRYLDAHPRTALLYARRWRPTRQPQPGPARQTPCRLANRPNRPLHPARS